MRKGKMERGITLIALILTIVILLILAIVAINSITNDGLLGKAENVTGAYNNSVINEQGTISGYEGFLDNYMDDSSVSAKVGSYVEYDVKYTDMYQGTPYNSTNGWRYLGTDDDGNKLIISTAIPMKLYFHETIEGEGEKWWDENKKSWGGYYGAVEGMLNNFDKIPYVQKEAGTTMSSGEENTAIGAFVANTQKYGYSAVGDYFKSSTYGEKILKVRVLTKSEMMKVRNDLAETSIKDLKNEALGLFNLDDLDGYENDYSYWLAQVSSWSSDTGVVKRRGIAQVSNGNGEETFSSWCYWESYSSEPYYWMGPCCKGGAVKDAGLRPVVVLDESVQLKDIDNDGRLEIN